MVSYVVMYLLNFQLQLQLLLLLFVVHDAFQLGNDTRQLFSIPVSYYLSNVDLLIYMINF